MRQTTQATHEIVYAAGRDLEDALRNHENNGRYTADKPGDAYDSVSYFDKLDFSYEVFRIEVITTVSKVEPPYER